MEQSVHFVTIATRDLDAARRFYIDGLGWTARLDVPDEIVFFQVAPGMLLAFFDADKFAEDTLQEPTRGPAGMNIAHNVGSPEAVREVVDRMRSAGGRVVKEPQHGAFGGIFHAQVEDPNGLLWEIAHNPGWSVSPDGSVSLG